MRVCVCVGKEGRGTHKDTAYKLDPIRNGTRETKETEKRRGRRDRRRGRGGEEEEERKRRRVEGRDTEISRQRYTEA